MAALRKIVGPRTGLSHSCLLPPALLICCRSMASKLFVGGLSFCTNDNALSEAFSEHGQVVEAKVVTDRVSNKSKGFGFVTFASLDEAHNAVTEMNGKVHINERPRSCTLSQALNGRVIFVDYAKPKTNYRGEIPIARGPPEPQPDT